MNWELAPDLQKEVVEIISTLDLSYIDPKRVIVFRSSGSKSRAFARIWSFPRIWQKALNKNLIIVSKFYLNILID